jgi:hypothetical protein
MDMSRSRPSTTASTLGRVRLLVVAIIVSLALMGCGSGYQGENFRIANELPEVAGVKLVEKSVGRYCSQHTCLYGNDRISIGFEFSVDTNAVTQQQLIDAYSAALDDWTPMIDRCANADPSFCDGLATVIFSRGGAVINLSFFSWRSGRFHIGVDARGARSSG